MPRSRFVACAAVGIVVRGSACRAAIWTSRRSTLRHERLPAVAALAGWLKRG